MASPAHCLYCFEVLSSSFNGREPPSLKAVEALYTQYAEAASKLVPTSAEAEADSKPGQQPADEDDQDDGADGEDVERRFPLFVTWNTLSRRGLKTLRGCIGTFEPLALEEGLRSYALTSAFSDIRFPPIPSTLLPSLACSITLLAAFEPCSHPLDWSIDVHGIRISFVYRGRRYAATYLPDVAKEQGWGREEALESLMRKAGYYGRHASTSSRLGRLLSVSAAEEEGDDKKPWEEVEDFKVTRYQGLKANVSYAEWCAWREWLDESGNLEKIDAET